MHGEAWQAFDFSGFDCAVHVAGIAHVSPKPQMTPLYEAVNRDLALACARRCKQAGVRQFIFLSSANVFGQAACAGQERLIAPDTPPRPPTPTAAPSSRPNRGCARSRTSIFAWRFCGR